MNEAARVRPNSVQYFVSASYKAYLLGFLKDFFTLRERVRLGGRIGMQGRVAGVDLLRRKGGRT
jgi:hypothetical protein